MRVRAPLSGQESLLSLDTNKNWSKAREERYGYIKVLLYYPGQLVSHSVSTAFVAKQSESALDSNSWILNRVNGSAQRRSLALEVGAFAAEGLLVSCFLCMCFVR